jgi:short-subunit dehydrogenase
MKLALITGASSGLGLELCKIAAANGYTLLVTGRQELPEALEAVKADLVHERGKVIDLIRRHAPDLVINCAGYGQYGPALNHSLDILELNANAAIEITIESARVMIEKNKPGVILNVSSAAGCIPMPYMALYGAAKAALTSFSRSFDAEMRSSGIRILVALPGQIDTPFAERASNGKYKQIGAMKKEYVARRLWKQIEREKGYQVIDWKVRLGLFFAKAFPRTAARMIMNSLALRQP